MLGSGGPCEMTGDAERGWTGAPRRQPSALVGWDVLLPPRWDVPHGSALAGFLRADGPMLRYVTSLQ